VISKEWVNESTRPLFPQNYADYYTDWYKLLPGEGHYKYMWYSLVREGDSYDFGAEGDKGQFIYVSPQKKLVIVRNGIEYGIPSAEWFQLFYEFASQF
jgi:CubicO group peptidase (beta-lactamase class C family)